jgi:tripartite-type tricarboxylate transporter receptor subunit TctC
VPVVFAALLCLILSVASVAAESFPSRPIRLLVPFPPGGIADLSGRLVAAGLRAKFNQPVIVENKPGANGVIGLRDLLKSQPDGYTLMVGTIAYVINFAMDVNAPYDAMRDMIPVAGVAEFATVMVVNNKLSVNSVKEFIDYAKARPGTLTFGSTGVGAMDYLAAELLMKQTGISMVHVPYKGGPLALNDLLGGSIDVVIEPVPVVIGQIKAGTIKALAVSSPYRLSSIPNVPTFSEAGVSDVELTGWLGVYGPPGISDDVRGKLGDAIVEIVKQRDIQEKLRAIGFEPMAQSVKVFSELHGAEVKRWVEFLSAIGVRK